MLITNSKTAEQKDILLCTLNSTYQHSSFGLRYLYANMKELQPTCHILEWTIKENPRLIVERILGYTPKIVGFGVYIWNTEFIFEVCSILKAVAPQIHLVLGGPEVSFETETQRLYPLADTIICGEADFLFREHCQNILAHKPEESKVLRGILPTIETIELPYDFYTEDDIKNRVIYVEASRGCPYKCEYCLSSLDKSVRSFNLQRFLKEIEKLIHRGARTFKFVDRTFNLSPTSSTTILQFFLGHLKDKSLFLHFEMVPDRLPKEIRELITRFPQGSLQFEVGIQTLNPEVAKNVSRKNDLTKVAENFQFIREHTKVHTHADLIVGLPGETLQSFAVGFDALSVLGPDEIQVGILKRLKGAPIARHEKTFKMIYQSFSPFQILSNSTMDYQTLQLMNRFAKFWDLYANSGEFKEFTLWIKNQQGSFFWNFMKFVDFLSARYSESHSISLMSLAESAWSYLQICDVSTLQASELIIQDYCNGHKKRDIPVFIKNSVRKSSDSIQTIVSPTAPAKNSLTGRQQAHSKN